MDYFKIDKDEIKNILKNYDQMRNNINQQRNQLLKLFDEYEELLQANCLNSTPPGEIISHGSETKDLYSIILKTKKQMIELKKDKQDELLSGNKEEYKIDRVMKCYRILSCYYPKGYNLIRMIYIENNKWDYVTQKTKIARGAISREVNRYLERMKIVYEFDVDTSFLEGKLITHMNEIRSVEENEIKDCWEAD